MEISSGLVIIYDNKILLGHPTGAKWFGTYSIPKGHVEEGEYYVDAAIRETYEEFGIKINIEQIQLNPCGYINYNDKNEQTYKKVFFYIVRLDKEIVVNVTQNMEIDWAGFLTKEEAEKRIFWRLTPVLKYLD